MAGLLIAALGVTAPGRDLLRSLIAAWPGLAILRDAQQFAAPLALAEAAGFGLAVAAALNPGPLAPAGPGNHGPFGHKPAPPRRPVRLDTAGTVLAVVALLAPVLLLPGLAWGAAGRLRSAWYPAAWLAVARSLDASPARGSVLLLPWATYRTPAWNHGEVVLDPWTRLLSRPVIWNDGTQVGAVALAPDDPGPAPVRRHQRGWPADCGAARGRGPVRPGRRGRPRTAAHRPAARIGRDHRPARPAVYQLPT